MPRIHQIILLTFFVFLSLFSTYFLVLNLKKPSVIKIGDVVITNEWQEIKENLPIPQGLDIKMDFQTGKKHVRLHDPTKKPDPNLRAVPVSEGPTISDPYTGKINVPPKWERVFAHHHDEIKDLIDKACLEDHQASVGALDKLELKAHQMNIGIGLISCQEVDKLITLIHDKNDEKRRFLTLIFQAALQNNQKAAEKALNTSLVAEFIQQLHAEINGDIAQEILNTLIMMVTSKTQETAKFFSENNGLKALGVIATRFKDHNKYVGQRILVLLGGLLIGTSDSSPYSKELMAEIETIADPSFDYGELTLKELSLVCKDKRSSRLTRLQKLCIEKVIPLNSK